MKKFNLYNSEEGFNHYSLAEFDSLAKVKSWLKENEDQIEVPYNLRILNNFAKPGERNVLVVNDDLSLEVIDHFKSSSEVVLPKPEMVYRNISLNPKEPLFVEFVEQQEYESAASSMEDPFFNLQYSAKSESDSLDFTSEKMFSVIKSSDSEPVGLCSFTRAQRNPEFFDRFDNECEYHCELDFIYLKDEYREKGYGSSIRDIIVDIARTDLKAAIGSVIESGSELVAKVISEPITPQGQVFSDELEQDVQYELSEIIENFNDNKVSISRSPQKEGELSLS